MSMEFLRWTLEDLVGEEEWVVEINPNTADSPIIPKTMQTARGTHSGAHRLRVFESPTPPPGWSFGGIIRTQAHHDELLRWAKKDNEIRVSDHLGRTFEVIIQGFTPVERQPTPTTPWRMTYTMSTLMLRRVA